jgi:hypothetical protein
MKNVQTLPERDPIDPTFAVTLSALHDIDEALFDAQCSHKDAHSASERQAAYTAFSQAVYELQGILTYVRSYQQRMRDGVEASTPGKIIPLRRRPGRIRDASGSDALPRIQQPRDARGQFVKRTT